MTLTATAPAGAATLPGAVEVREIGTPAECARACELVCEVWSALPTQAPMEPNLLRALAFAGGYVAAAFDRHGDDMVGVCVGFFGHDPADGMHSHLAAVAPQAQRRGIGTALKLHQRAWAAERGVPTIGWTFDPLVGRNAALNLTRLGAGVTDYLVDFYGDMRDGVNAGHGSDRLLVRWDVEPGPAAAQPLPGAVPLLSAGADDAPVLHAAGAGAVSVAVPADIAALRRRDPAVARTWRHAVRAAVAPRLAAGWRVRGFDAAAGYLLEPPTAAPTPPATPAPADTPCGRS